MINAIYVNMVVADLQRSRKFFTALGMSFNETFSNDDAASLVISDTIYAMLHTRPSIARFTDKEVIDPRKSFEVLLALQVGSREEVGTLFEKAMQAGGREARPAADHGFMLEHAFEDPDGHIWEVFWMDEKGFPAEE